MEIPDENEDYHLKNLYEVKYDSKFTIINAGTLYIVFIVFIIEGILLYLTTLCFMITKRGRKLH